MSDKNPHAKAVGAYGATAASTDQRALEGQILLKAAQKLEDLAQVLQEGKKPSLEDIGSTLEYNQKLWQLFLEDVANPGNALPQEIKNNVASLAVFVFKRTQEILIDTQADKFKVLININRNIAAGLMKRPAEAAAAAKTSARTSSSGATPADVSA